jgi:hypothetical protein
MELLMLHETGLEEHLTLSPVTWAMLAMISWQISRLGGRG